MNQYYKLEIKDEYLRVESIKDLDFNEIKLAIECLLEDIKKHNAKRLLIDMRNSKINISTSDRFYIGKYLASLSMKLGKIACLLLEEQMQKKFLENVAVNRGLNILATVEEKEAILWLLK